MRSWTIASYARVAPKRKLCCVAAVSSRADSARRSCSTASAGRASSPKPSTSAAIWVSSALSVALSDRARGKPSIAMAR